MDGPEVRGGDSLLFFNALVRSLVHILHACGMFRRFLKLHEHAVLKH